MSDSSLNKIIIIAGGSGSGKSTVSISLCKKYPDECALLHVDDYFKKSEYVPHQDELANWDHPDAVRLDDLYRDLILLRNNKPIAILTKSELYNPGYRSELRNKIEHTVEPKKVIILEGYLALYDERIRTIASKKIYLDMSIEESTKRRSENKFDLDTTYFEKILAPMYKKFVEPTKQFADLVIDVSNKTKEEVFSLVEDEVLNGHDRQRTL